MGLKEKQAMRDFDEKFVPRFEKHVAEHGIQLKFTVDWSDFPAEARYAFSSAEAVVRELATRMWDFGQDAMAREEITKQLKTVTVKHDGSIAPEDKYNFRIEKAGDNLVFRANMTSFTISSSSSNQKSFKAAISDVL